MTWFVMPANGSEGSKPESADRVQHISNAGRPPRILIVEDEYLIALELENRLLDAGCEIVGIAPSAGEAILMAGNQAPDLAIVDIRLAGRRDGVETATELSIRFGIRSIFSSAHAADALTRNRAAPASPIGWLQKPYPAAALIGLMRAYLQNAR